MSFLHAESGFRSRIALFFLALCLMVWPVGIEAVNSAPESVAGICLRPQPFPNQEAYLFCRANAWLDALQKALPFLPASAERHLWEMDLNSEAGRLALAGLLFPVEASTPDISASPEVRVFLAINQEYDLAPIWANPERLLMEIALIDEMRFTLDEMRANFQSGENSTSDTPEFSRALDALWRLAVPVEDDVMPTLSISSSAMKNAAAISSQPPMVLLAKAQAALDAEMPQDAQALAAKAFIACEKRLVTTDANDKAWTMLLAWSSYLRGLAHWRLNQDALARGDLDKAAKLAREVGVQLPLLASITLASAELSRHRGFTPQMCKELEEACALGSCAELAAARRQGLCAKSDDKQ